MHQNHYFLKHLANELDAQITGYSLIECFCQDKDELILGFNVGANEFFIKADLADGRGILSFPQKFTRARKNSVDLFSKIIGKNVLAVSVHLNERSLQILFSSGLHLIFRLFGRDCNILLFNDGKFHSAFKKSGVDWSAVLLMDFDRKIDQNYEAFKKAGGEVKQIFPTLGKIPTAYLEQKGFNNLSLQDQWQELNKLIELLNKAEFYLINFQNRMHLSLIRIGEVIATYHSAIEAANAFQNHYFNVELFEKERSKTLKKVDREIQRAKKYIENTRAKAEDLKQKDYGRLADLIMAHLHEIKANQREVELVDFFDHQKVMIRLNPKLSPQKNAERFYQKAKNQGLEIRSLKRTIAQRIQEVKTLEEQKKSLVMASTLKDLRVHDIQKQKSAPKKALPYNTFEIEGYKVLVGKGAKANDELTLKIAHKDDMWFHARDVAGSHVILKFQAGKNFPASVIEKTAQLAAWFSKGRNFPLCPVIRTPKKNVRKPKGFAPGMVKVEKEKVILVEPRKVTS